MDFFSSRPAANADPTIPDTSVAAETPFAQAISRRFSGPATASLLTTRLDPPTAALPLPTSIPELSFPPIRLGARPGAPTAALAPPLAKRKPMAASATDASSFNAVPPSQIASIIALPETLIIDIRPHAQFQVARLPNAVSVNVPSTLLRRPNFDLEKISSMISEPESKANFLRWKSAPRLLAYDADSAVLTESNNLLGLLRKFRTAGYSGEISWIEGGMVAAYRETRELVEDAIVSLTTPPTPDIQQAIPRSAENLLRPRNLPREAFQQSSTTMIGPTMPTASQPSPAIAMANPFYDNIRQNVELSGGVGDRISLNLSPRIIARKNDLPFPWLQDLAAQAQSADQGAETLAMQFYQVELREQRRLNGIMTFHSREGVQSNTTPMAAAEFPYSITAGIEMGTKNRYRNIWPFEHARVRLRTVSAIDGSDYVNASYVQPMITSRRYIATQGPLPTTFNDFWAICWEQNVPAIVMLTREIEGNHIKCGCYWTEGQYGNLQLKLLEQQGISDVIDPTAAQGSSFNFGPADPQHDASLDVIIKRVFSLRNVDRPDIPERKVVHLQYLGWPDLNVPDSTTGVLELIKQVNVAMTESSTAEGIERGPVLLHCSAGVGRTGGFIIADAVLDGIRREMRKNTMGRWQPHNLPSLMALYQQHNADSSSEAMDLDEPESMSSQSNVQRINIRSNSPYVIGSTGGFPSLAQVANSSQSDVFAGASSLPSSIADMSGLRAPYASTSATVAAASSVPSLHPKLGNLPHPALDRVVSASTSGSNKPSPLSSTVNIGEWSAKVSSKGPRSTSVSGMPLSELDSMDPIESSGAPSPESNSENDLIPDADIYYKHPRQLHSKDSPPLLSGLKDPIRDVLEDMREQRMSLCQSLRQYVFVHRVVIEGALELVDEERALAERNPLQSPQHERALFPPYAAPSQPLNFWSSTSSLSSASETPLPLSMSIPKSTSRTSSMSMPNPITILRNGSPPTPLTPMKHLRISSPAPSSPLARPKAGRLAGEGPRTPGSIAIGMPPPVLTGKRNHSPSLRDELHQENILGKRPSIKRKQRVDDLTEAKGGDGPNTHGGTPLR